jgi:hypothetical protein
MVTLTGVLPVATAALVAISVRVLVVVVLDGLKDADTPLGRPEADRATLPVNVLLGVTVTVLEPLAPPAVMAMLLPAERRKAGATAAAFTVRLSVAV